MDHKGHHTLPRQVWSTDFNMTGDVEEVTSGVLASLEEHLQKVLRETWQSARKRASTKRSYEHMGESIKQCRRPQRRTRCTVVSLAIDTR